MSISEVKSIAIANVALLKNELFIISLPLAQFVVNILGNVSAAEYEKKIKEYKKFYESTYLIHKELTTKLKQNEELLCRLEKQLLLRDLHL